MKLSEKDDNTLNALRQKLGPIMGTRSTFRSAGTFLLKPAGQVNGKNICHGFKKEFFFLTFGRVKN